MSNEPTEPKTPQTGRVSLLLSRFEKLSSTTSASVSEARSSITAGSVASLAQGKALNRYATPMNQQYYTTRLANGTEKDFLKDVLEADLTAQKVVLTPPSPVN